LVKTAVLNDFAPSATIPLSCALVTGTRVRPLVQALINGRFCTPAIERLLLRGSFRSNLLRPYRQNPTVSSRKGQFVRASVCFYTKDWCANSRSRFART